MLTTSNYKLKKPEGTDLVDIGDFNENTDIIDSELAKRAGKDVVTQSANGLMSAADKKKLDGVAAGANAYVHPSAHPASMITPDASHRFVTDAEKTVWNGKQDKLTVDSALSSASTNPVQNKAVNAALAGKAAASHTHNYAGSSSAGGAAATALACTGNAATATSAAKATQDSAGQQINSTYIKGLSANGKTITYTKGNGVTGSITTQDTVYSPFSGATVSSAGRSGLVPAPGAGKQGQFLRGDGTWQTPADTNTWRGIQNNLTSTSTTDSLAAAQGKVLNDKISKLNTDLAVISSNFKGTVIISNQNQTTSAKYTKNYVLSEGNHILTASTSAGIGCYLLTVISNSIYWTQITALPSQVSLAKSGLTVGVTYQKGASGIVSLTQI